MSSDKRLMTKETQNLEIFIKVTIRKISELSLQTYVLKKVILWKQGILQQRTERLEYDSGIKYNRAFFGDDYGRNVG